MSGAKNPLAVIVGDNIRKEAGAQGLTVKAFAEKLNITESTLLAWVEGRKMITVYGLVMARRILGVPLEKLIEGI